MEHRRTTETPKASHLSTTRPSWEMTQPPVEPYFDSGQRLASRTLEDGRSYTRCDPY